MSVSAAEQPASGTRKASGVAQLLVQLARRVLEKRDADDLHAVQWSVLRYLDRAGRRTATVRGVSVFLGNTTGSASRTVKSLAERGLVVGTTSRRDARSVVFTLTPKGSEMLARDPLGDLAEVLGVLNEDDLDRLGDLLDRVQAALDKART